MYSAHPLCIVALFKLHRFSTHLRCSLLLAVIDSLNQNTVVLVNELTMQSQTGKALPKLSIRHELMWVFTVGGALLTYSYLQNILFTHFNQSYLLQSAVRPHQKSPCYSAIYWTYFTYFV